MYRNIFVAESRPNSIIISINLGYDLDLGYDNWQVESIPKDKIISVDATEEGIEVNIVDRNE